MKKIAIALVALCTVFSLAGCSNTGGTSKNEDSESSVVSKEKHTLYASPSSVILRKGDTQQVNLTLDGKNISLSDYNWKCDDEKIATVDANGIITGIIPGICTVEAFSLSDSDIKVKIEVTVTASNASIPELSSETSETASKEESSAPQSSDESSDTSSKEESSDSSDQESSDESSDTVIVTDSTAYTLFDSDDPSYDSETLDKVHDYILSIEDSGEVISTDNLSKEQAQLLVNMIYATYGLEFEEGGSIREGLDECDWYEATASDSYEAVENMGDQENIKDSIDALGEYINSF